MEETTKWRVKELPVTIDEPTKKMLVHVASLRTQELFISAGGISNTAQ